MINLFSIQGVEQAAEVATNPAAQTTVQERLAAVGFFAPRIRASCSPFFPPRAPASPCACTARSFLQARGFLAFACLPTARIKSSRPSPRRLGRSISPLRRPRTARVLRRRSRVFSKKTPHFPTGFCSPWRRSEKKRGKTLQNCSKCFIMKEDKVATRGRTAPISPALAAKTCKRG